MSERLDADVAVVGAGPAGSTTARLLAQQGWDVLLVDRERFPRSKTCGDGLTPRCVADLQRLDLLPQLLEAGYPRVKGARMVAPNGHDWRPRFAEYVPRLPAYGLVVPRSELDERLRQRAVDAGVRFLDGYHAREVLRADGRVTGLQGVLDGNIRTIHARLTVAATGASVGLLRVLGALHKLPTMVRAARAYFDGVEGLDGDFEFHFRREITAGYAWIFPSPGGRANVGVGLFPRLGGGTGGRSPKQTLHAFLDRPDVRRRFRHARMVSPLEAFPLRTDFPCSPVCGSGFLFVGEAAGLVSPVTGEGISFALESGEIAAAAASKALRRDDLSLRGLRAYERALWRRFGPWFAAIRRIQPRVMQARPLNVLIHKARHRARLGRTVVGIIMGTTSPWLAFSPLTWWQILS
jgi:geranylgeranyl reductase family protein